jgi:hypothetical protein
MTCDKRDRNVSANFEDFDWPRIRYAIRRSGLKNSRFAEMGAPAGFWDNTALS